MKHLIWFMMVSACAPAYALDCRPQIRAAVCHAKGAFQHMNRPCLGDEQIYLPMIEAVHEALPDKLRAMFCYVRRIYIEENLDSSAFSLASADGHVIGLSRRNLFSGMDYAEWQARKEQTAFGFPFEKTPLHLRAGPLHSFFPGPAQAVLLYVFLHEFGHLIETVNGLDDLWTSIGWLPKGRLRAAHRLGSRTPCYYGCLPEETWQPAEADRVYKQLRQTNVFVTTYAAVNPHEDFAETFFVHSARKYFGLNAYVEAAGKKHSMDYRLGVVAQKLKFMAGLDSRLWLYGAHNLCAKSEPGTQSGDIRVEGCARLP